MYNTDQFLGIPYVQGACGFDGCDCWGLVRLVERTLFHVELPAFTADIDLVKDIDGFADIVRAHKGLFHRLAAPLDGSIALLRIRGRACHTAVYVNGDLLHVDLSCKEGARIVRCTDYAIAKRIEGYYSGQ